MPVVILAIFIAIIFFVFISVLGATINEIPDTENVVSLIVLAVIPIGLILITLIGWAIAYNKCPWEYREVITQVETRDNVDYVIIDEEFINLNSYFKRDFQEAQKIKILLPVVKFYKGVYPGEVDYQMKFEELE